MTNKTSAKGGEYMNKLSKLKISLLKIKMLISEGKCSLEEHREKNIHTLSTLGLLPEEVFQILLELTPKNYYRGPSTDYDTNETDCIWEFGVVIEQKQIYIKLKLIRDFVKDISFHFAEKELTFPFENE